MNAWAYWLRSYALMVAWDFRNLRLVLPLAIVVQITISTGSVLGFGLLMGERSPTRALLLAAGVTVTSIIALGIVMATELVTAQEQSGTYKFVMSSPVPRTILIAAGLTVNSLIAIPGAMVALAIAWWRYDVPSALHIILLPTILRGL